MAITVSQDEQRGPHAEAGNPLQTTTDNDVNESTASAIRQLSTDDCQLMAVEHFRAQDDEMVGGMDPHEEAIDEQFENDSSSAPIPVHLSIVICFHSSSLFAIFITTIKISQYSINEYILTLLSDDSSEANQTRHSDRTRLVFNRTDHYSKTTSTTRFASR